MPEYYGDILGTRDFMRQAASQIEGELGERLEFWSKNLNKQLGRKKGIKEMHYNVTKDVRSAVVNRYKATRISRGKGYRGVDTGNYRRFSNGRMLKALYSKAVVTHDQNGIYLYNMGELDKRAAQWYRLNFGAKPRGKQKSGPTSPMKFFGATTGLRVNLDRFGPSDPLTSFKLPVGFWSSTKAPETPGAKLRKGNTAFYPSKLGPKPSRNMGPPKKLIPRRGIHGTGFLDQGLTVLNNRYPKELEKIVRHWMDSGL